MICERCKHEATGSICSMFNEQQICMNCSDEERMHPKFEEAKKADWLAILQGNYNFPGIGLPNDLRLTNEQ